MGDGASLSLIDPLFDNAMAASWESMEEGGTPGRANERDSVIAPPPGPDPEIRVYPNPVEERLEVFYSDLVGTEILIELYSPLGSMVGRWRVPNDDPSIKKAELNLGTLQTGLYYVNIISENAILSYPILKR